MASPSTRWSRTGSTSAPARASCSTRWIAARAGRRSRAGFPGSPPSNHGSPSQPMQLEVTVPSLLRDCIGDQPLVFLEAGTLAEALDRLLEGYPLLGIHLYDEAG